LNDGNLNYCVLIPTYNNDRTLAEVISGAMFYAAAVIIVNDGSTDRTGEVLERFRGIIDIITFSKNRGKGAALRRGLQRAAELGYQYAITLDADGQHLPTEIPKLLEKVRPGADSLIIGSRDLTTANVPSKSIFGRKFSNFWVKLETNRDLVDTQSGFRLYPVAKINQFHFFTVKYDFELETLVRWIWRGYPVEIAPIKVYYPPPAERVSHFKGFRDNFYLSRLNTVLVIITIVYIAPRRFFRLMVKIIKNFFRLPVKNEE